MLKVTDNIDIEATRYVEENSVEVVKIPRTISLIILFIHAMTRGAGIMGLIVASLFIALGTFAGNGFSLELIIMAMLISLCIASALALMNIINLNQSGMTQTFISLLISENWIARNIAKPFITRP